MRTLVARPLKASVLSELSGLIVLEATMFYSKTVNFQEMEDLLHPILWIEEWAYGAC
jgi:hypothetical protein